MEKSLGNPIVYIFITIIHASIISVTINYSLIGVVIFTTSFCSCLYIMQNKKMIIINIILFFAVIINCFVYYNLQIDSNHYVEIRVTDKYGKDFIGQCGNRRIKLVGVKDLQISRMYYMKGNYSENINTESRTIGDLKVKYIKTGKQDFILKLSEYRNKLAEKIKNNMGKKQSELLLSSSIGMKNEMSYENKKLLNSIGISHIVSLSGLHVMIIGMFFRKIFGEKLSILILGLYVMFTGMMTSSIRAFIMLILVRLGNILNKKYNSLAALSLGGSIMILYKPYYVFDIGFVLSYLATLGIILLNKKINRGLYRFPKNIRETISISLAANAFTFPYICITIKKFSLFFLLGNLLIVPLFTPLLIGGNLLVIFQYIPWLFKITCTLLNYICNVILYLSKLINFLGIEPIEISETIFGVYCMCFMAYYFYNKGWKEFKKLYYIVPFYAIISFIIQYSSMNS